MDNFVMIAVCLIAGMVFQAVRLVPADAHKGINTWILYMALPAVSFKYIPTIHWSAQMFFPALSTMLVWAGSWIFIELYCMSKGYGQRTRSALELVSGYGNTSFVGFPLIAAYFGEQYLSIAIICDQMMFLLLSSTGIVCAVKGDRSGTGRADAAVILKRLVTFPPLIGCISALVLSHFFNLSFAAPFFGKLAGTVGPLALFSVGLQLKFTGWKRQLSQLSVTALYKLMIAPALVLLVALLIGVKGDIARISVFEAAMPTLLTGGIIASQFNLNVRLVNLVIGVSILAGFVTTAFWDGVLQWIKI